MIELAMSFVTIFWAILLALFIVIGTMVFVGIGLFVVYIVFCTCVGIVSAVVLAIAGILFEWYNKLTGKNGG